MCKQINTLDPIPADELVRENNPTPDDCSEPKYRLGIIDRNVELPAEIDRTHTSLDEAYDALSTFVHSYDGIEQVNGRVLDENDEDMEYVSSILE